MDWMWEYYTYMSQAAQPMAELELAAKEITEQIGKLFDDVAAELRRLFSTLACESVKKSTRRGRQRTAAELLPRPWRARRLAMQQNRPPGIAPG